MTVTVHNTITSEDVAWAAGFYDGEGCTLIKQMAPYGNYLGISLPQAGSPELLEKFQKICFGFGTIGGPTISKKHPNHQPQWCLQVSAFNDVQAIVALLWKYLGTPKRQQALKCLRLGRSTSRHNRSHIIIDEFLNSNLQAAEVTLEDGWIKRRAIQEWVRRKHRDEVQVRTHRGRVFLVRL